MKTLTKYFYNGMSSHLNQFKPNKTTVKQWYEDKIKDLQSYVWVTNHGADLAITEGYAKAYADYLGINWSKTFPKDWI
jgi:hypothetical protein